MQQHFGAEAGARRVGAGTVEQRSVRSAGRRASAATSRISSRAIPAAVPREILHDDGRCSYADPRTGRRYASRHLLEIDHRVPYARGGSAERANLRLLCGHHRHRHRHAEHQPARVRWLIVDACRAVRHHPGFRTTHAIDAIEASFRNAIGSRLDNIRLCWSTWVAKRVPTCA